MPIASSGLFSLAKLRGLLLAKTTKDFAGALFPTPVALVTTVDAAGKANIITLAWVGIVCSSPLMLSLAIRPGRYSAVLLEDIPELVVNIPSRQFVSQTDYCGMVSGRDVDKFKDADLTALSAALVKPPLIEECPINLECKVANRLSLGTHDVFIVEVVKTHVDEEALDETGKIDFSRVAPFVYAGMDYWTLAEKIGHYGYTKRG